MPSKVRYLRVVGKELHVPIDSQLGKILAKLVLDTIKIYASIPDEDGLVALLRMRKIVDGQVELVPGEDLSLDIGDADA